MKTSKSEDLFRPFENLNDRLRSKALKLPGKPAKPVPVRTKGEALTGGRETDERLFEKAMTDVTPMGPQNIIEPRHQPQPACPPTMDEDNDVLLKLKDLVIHGKGFVVADTPEYIEGTGYRIPPEILKRLHRGDFSVQAHVDLHGLRVRQARQVFDRFLTDSLRTGKRSVLIVHGRGLSSPQEPVLKTRIRKWLTSGQWRKWLIGYASARLCDGGAGATYVLLRQNPLSKSRRRKQPSD